MKAVLAPWLAESIEHIGSTAVPLLPAKPVIDIMAPVHTGRITRCNRGSNERRIRLLPIQGRSHALVLQAVARSPNSPSPFGALRKFVVHRQLGFRDALRKSQALAAEYAELKRRLAETFRLDRVAYTEAKAPFVQRVLCDFILTGRRVEISRSLGAAGREARRSTPGRSRGLRSYFPGENRAAQ